MQTKVILVHGNGGGTGQDQWLPYVKRELEGLGLVVLAPDMPDSDLARMNIWVPYLKDDLGADENTIIVGHSSGAVAAMRLAEDTKLLGSVLVGTCYTDLGYESEKVSGYYDAPWQWDKIKENQKWISIFASVDDPYIDISEPRFIHDQLDCEYHEYVNEGHFGGDKDKIAFPEVAAVIRNKLSLN